MATRTAHAPLRLIPPLHRATHRVGLFIARLADLGVTQPEAHVLDHLATYGATTVGDLHRAFAHRRSTLTSVLDRLSARRLISRHASVEDRRTFVIELNAKGRTLAAGVHEALQQVESRALNSLSQRDLASFHRVLDAIERALSQADD